MFSADGAILILDFTIMACALYRMHCTEVYERHFVLLLMMFIGYTILTIGDIDRVCSYLDFGALSIFSGNIRQLVVKSLLSFGMVYMVIRGDSRKEKAKVIYDQKQELEAQVDQVASPAAKSILRGIIGVLK